MYNDIEHPFIAICQAFCSGTAHKKFTMITRADLPLKFMVINEAKWVLTF